MRTRTTLIISTLAIAIVAGGSTVYLTNTYPPLTAEQQAVDPKDYTTFIPGTELTKKETKKAQETYDDSFHAFTLSDGTTILVDAERPLPDNLVADTATQASALVAASPGEADTQASMNGLYTLTSNLESVTGRTVLLVAQAYQNTDGTPSETLNWVGFVKGEIVTDASEKKDDVVKQAQAKADAAEDSKLWDVIVADTAKPKK